MTWDARGRDIEFEDKVLILATDEGQTVEDRIRRIDDFILKSESISEAAQGFAQTFNDIKSKLTDFTGSFSGWAKDKEQQDSNKLTMARGELAELNNKLSELQTAFIATASVAVASLPVTGILVILAGLFAPFVIIGGLAVAQASTAVTIALSTQITLQDCVFFLFITKNDCTKIIEWLQQGRQDADMPLYMKISLDQAAGVYKALAKFLQAYVNGLSK
ncbi:hypothetical protein L211DRAFT_853482 [Terfezia boudieri ATCC MYA-4762]|uniref:Uncharacterized protein n=1 Tax=Terfezia boudieri ATCC MYA-4762 TaxID=1051890 RepID=A0A3N4LEM4_9PEZI|nr:hypothetical protein L211DRAFT_853482 [Terfezia boudieri ATCC MYA-4762]